jgi:tRNA(fMet)-specific endonuclease VapC
MRYTLDTNICSYLLKQQPEAFSARYERLATSDIWVSSLVAAELRFGVAWARSTRIGALVEAWLAALEVRPWPVEASHHYAGLRAA